MKTKLILVILNSLIQVILDSMKKMEESGDIDAYGVPLSEEYDKQGFILASLRDIVSDIKLNCDENEK